MNYFHKSKNTNKKQGGRNAESRPSNDHDAKPALKEKLVNLGRSSKSNKGGRRFSFNALVVVGNQKGSVGIGQGKAKEVPDAVQKATQRGGRQLHTICLSGTTIPHIVIGKASGSRVLLKPAAPGTGIKAGGAVRAVLENAGVQDILSKSLGSNNKGSLVKATLDALKQLRSREDMRRVRQ
jgi:small subunit ribosomal protein S5